MQRFDEYVAEALYGADGFYTSGRGIAGRRGGDFITSPEVGPLFGALVAEWVNRVWEQRGRPASFAVFDVGTGPGTLLRSLAAAEPECAQAWTLQGIDLATASELPGSLEGAVVIANELLDNVPFRWVRSSREDGEDGEEAFVANGAIAWRPFKGPLLAEGEYPLVEGAAALVQSVLDREPAGVLVFDYGAATTAELARRGGWLRCYREHQRSNDPLRNPGWWDITTDVPLDQLPFPAKTWTQAEFCAELGIEALVAEGRAYWRHHAAKPDLSAVRMRSRVSEAEALTDPTGLGAFWVAEWS
ncbi:MAG: hypothetical protein HKN03_13050 [Acidimicrobiales bacterium]|nr:hypothetical protein [Acidimicrobiales bacterium]